MANYDETISALCTLVEKYDDIEGADQIMSELLNYLYVNRTKACGVEQPTWG